MSAPWPITDDGGSRKDERQRFSTDRGNTAKQEAKIDSGECMGGGMVDSRLRFELPVLGGWMRRLMIKREM